MPHPKKETTDHKRRRNERQNANASAKSKELQANTQYQRFAAHLLLPQPHCGQCINIKELRANVIYKKCFPFS
jgi:hypothetical protein